ncbi:hypothetical protein ACI65C_005841 [Semiaphis heraclei]
MRHDTAVFGSAFGYGGGESALLATLVWILQKYASVTIIIVTVISRTTFDQQHTHTSVHLFVIQSRRSFTQTPGGRKPLSSQALAVYDVGPAPKTPIPT